MTIPEGIRKEAAKLREEIEEHNRRYYLEAAPIISDFDYDKLLARLVEIENAYPDLRTPDSPTPVRLKPLIMISVSTGGASLSVSIG